MTSSAKAEDTNRVWRRVRQLRTVVHAILQGLGMLADDSSSERMTPSTTNRNKDVAYVAVYDGPGAVSSSGHDPIWIVRSLDHLDWLEAALIGPEEVCHGTLEQFDAVVFGGGSSSKQAESLGQDGRGQVRRFVREGGGYVGICAGAFLASCNRDTQLRLINAHMSAGSGTSIVRLEFTEEGRQILGTDAAAPTKYSNGPKSMVPADESTLPPFRVLARFASDVSPKTQLTGEVAIAVSEFGRGRVIVFSPHCERYPGPQVAFWRALACGSDIDPIGSTRPPAQ